MKSQAKPKVAVIKNSVTEEVAEGCLVIKVNQVIVGFSYSNGERFTMPMPAGKFKFRIVPSPASIVLSAYRLFELNPVVFINQAFLQSHSADVCEVILTPTQNMALVQ